MDGVTLQQQILEGLLNRDERALMLFISNYGRQIRQALWRKYRDFADKEELDSVFNFAVGYFWSNIRSYDPNKSTLEGWVFGIAQKIAQRGLRTNCFELPESLSDEASRPDGAEPASVTRLLSFIDEELTERERSVIRADLAAGDKADDGRLAEQHNTTTRSIQSTRAQARRKIKQARAQILAGELIQNEL